MCAKEAATHTETAHSLKEQRVCVSVCLCVSEQLKSGMEENERKKRRREIFFKCIRNIIAHYD